MPFYFAYGANLDITAMAVRCPRAKPAGVGRLANHRFHIMPDGVASVRRERGSVVHGLLWDLALSDVAPLDAFEEVGAGLYRKVIHPILRRVGSAQAFLYVGHTQQDGVPRPGYLESVTAAARDVGLPGDYVRTLAVWSRAGSRGSPFDNVSGDTSSRRNPGVRPRFATPYDRS